MGRGRLSKDEIRILRESPYVLDINENRIIYTDEFKLMFMAEYLSGKGPTQIFREAGFDPVILGSKRIERAAARWKESYAAGSLGKM
ncbi:MAG: HTH domain-containing protein [Anaerovoracaceae bacterium]|mgnify:CR=1 FL=1|nr:HTH domain-containing protein [Anaerovoracaceae bacterium]